MAHFAENAHWADPSPLFAPYGPLDCKNEYLVFALAKETVTQPVVGSSGVSQAQKPRGRESPRGVSERLAATRFTAFALNFPFSLLYFCSGGPHDGIAASKHVLTVWTKNNDEDQVAHRFLFF